MNLNISSTFAIFTAYRHINTLYFSVNHVICSSLKYNKSALC